MEQYGVLQEEDKRPRQDERRGESGAVMQLHNNASTVMQ